MKIIRRRFQQAFVADEIEGRTFAARSRRNRLLPFFARQHASLNQQRLLFPSENPLVQFQVNKPMLSAAGGGSNGR